MKPYVTTWKNKIPSAIYTSLVINTFIFITLMLISITSAGCGASGSAELGSASVSDDSVKKGEKVFIFHEEKDGEDNLWKAVFKDNKLISLYRNDSKIPEDQLEKYNDIVYTNIDVISDDGGEQFLPYGFSHGRHKYFDEKKFNHQMKMLGKKLEKLKFDPDSSWFDNEKFEHEMNMLCDKLSHMRINVNIDSGMFDCNMTGIIKDHDFFDGEKFKHEMKKLSAELKNNALAMKDFKLNMPDFEKKMKILDEKMRDFKIDMHGLKSKMKKLKSFVTDLRLQLEKDGYIKNEDEDFDLTLNGHEMILNGKKMPENVFQKYRELYKKNFGKEITDDNPFIIRK